MRRRSTRLLALAVSALLLSLAGAPASAAEAGGAVAGGSGIDGLYARIWNGPRRAVMLMEATDDGGRLSAFLAGLTPGAE